MKLVSPEFHYELVELANSLGNVGLAAPRGHAKSTVLNLVYLAWLIVHQKHHFILSVSDTLSQSIEFVNTLKNELATNPILKMLYGNLEGNVWGAGVFETSTGVRVMARAYGMKIRGLKYRQYRPELLLFDDLENDESVNSADQREKLKAWFTRAALPGLAKGGRAVVIGTILHGDSLLKNIVDKKGEFSGWTTRLFSALNTAQNGQEYALWPEMYSVRELKAMRDIPTSPSYIGSLAFQQEYQNEPVDEKDAIIKRAWIRRCDILPKDIIVKAVFVDPAIAKGDNADFTGKIAAATDSRDNLYIYKIGNDRLSFSESAKAIYEWDEMLDPAYTAIETVQFQAAFKDVLKGLAIVELEPDKDKRRRTLAVSRFFEGGNVYILNGIDNAEVLIDQLVHFPSVKHDDLVDAVVYAIDKMLVKRFGTYGTVQPGEHGSGVTAGLDEVRY